MVVLQNGELRADWVPEHGMVCASLRHGERELLGQRGGLAKYADSGSTFGIPLLHPWANRLDAEVDSSRVRLDGETGLPIHGLLNGWPDWAVQDVTRDSVRAAFPFDAHPELLSAFPYPHQIEVQATLASDALTVATRIVSTGDEPVPIAFGWHPYFNLPDAQRDEIELSLPPLRQLALDDSKLPVSGESAPFEHTGALGGRDWDDAYAGVDPGALFAIGDIAVEFTSGYTHAQVYSPADSTLIALEPMTAPANALKSGDGLRHVEPGGSFEAVFRVLVHTNP